MTFPFTPSTVKNEHPKFYLTKLAEANGYSFMEDLLHANSQKLPIHQAQQFNAFKAVIFELTGFNYEITYVDCDVYQHKRYFPSLLSPHAKICPTCCKEGYSPIEHSFLFANRCDMHEIQLIDTCSVCNQALEWDNLLLQGKCNYCGSHLPELEIEESKIQSYVKMHGLKQSLPFLNDLCLMASHLIRPLDNHPESITKKRIVNSGELFNKAYRVLTDVDLCGTWLKHLHANRSTGLASLGKGAIEAPFCNVISLLNLDNWPITNKSIMPSVNKSSKFSFIENDVEEFSIQTQWKTKNKNIVEQNTLAQYKCSAQLLAKILECELNTVFSLSRYGLFSSLNTKGYSENTYIDLREVDQCLPNSFNFEGYVGKNILSFTEIKRILPHFNIAESCFITTIIRDQVPVSLIQESLSFFTRLQITTYMFYRTLKKMILVDSNDKIEHSKAMHCYRLREVDIRALLHNKKITTQKWRQVATYYKTVDFELMEKSYFNLARYCYFRGLNFTAISERLKLKGILPALGKSYYDHRRYVIHFIKTGKVILLNQNPPKNQNPSTKSISSFLSSMPILSNKKR
jgi:hypothetical protein